MNTRARLLGRGIGAAGGIALGCFFAGCGGSSDSGGTEPNTALLVTDLCDKMRSAPCGSAEVEQQCLEQYERDQDDAANQGCESELNAYLQCATAGSITCITDEGLDSEARPVVASACSDKYGVFSECVTGVAPECGVGYGPGTDSVSCSVTCPDFSSMCTGPSQFGPLECTCATGPNAGVAFQAADCSRGIVMATGHTCR